jgi:pimeloyl-ACP methyl ester carboxylesterase
VPWASPALRKAGLALAVIVDIVCSPACRSADAPPSRGTIFADDRSARPVVSASGNWIAEAGGNAYTAIRLVGHGGTGAPQLISLPGVSQLYWYRWSAGADQLMISCVQRGQDMVLLLEPGTGTVSGLVGPDDRSNGSFATFRNNYAFTYDRFRNVRTGEQSDVSASAQLVPVEDAKNLVPAFLSASENYLAAGVDGGEFTWRFGTAHRSTLALTQAELRQGAALVSLSADGRAFFLRSPASGILSLLAYDLKTGEETTVAQPTADIRRVILDPVDKLPDAVEYELAAPRLDLLNERIRPDVAYLSSRGWGFPTILDRSPNDRFWIVQYQHRDGLPIWVVYDRQARAVKELAYKNKSDTVAWTLKSFVVARTAGQPFLSGHVSLPGACGAEKCPAVLLLHGGPAERDFAAFNAERYWLISRGIAVISVNYRGSSGFGRDYERLDAKEWNRGIPRDIDDALDDVMRTYAIDPDRVAIVGTSFSGYLALNFLAEPSRFRCGVVDSVAPDLLAFSVDRLARFGEHSDLLYRIGDPRIPAQRAALEAMSPLAKIGALRHARLLHFQGALDEITPIANTAEFTRKLLAVDPDYTYVHFAGEGHGLPGARGQYHALAEQFLGKCLGVVAEKMTETEKSGMGQEWIYGNRSFYGGAATRQ